MTQTIEQLTARVRELEEDAETYAKKDKANYELRQQLVVVQEEIANETAWQPIETAPVLSNVLVTRIDYGQVCWVTDARKSKFGFWSTFNGRAVNEPTHWMPLPKAPSGASI